MVGCPHRSSPASPRHRSRHFSRATRTCGIRTRDLPHTRNLL
jgi:hypothetical protein